MRKGKLCYFASLELLIRKSFFVIHIFPVESKESGHFIHYKFFFFVKEFKQRGWVFQKMLVITLHIMIIIIISVFLPFSRCNRVKLWWWKTCAFPLVNGQRRCKLYCAGCQLPVTVSVRPPLFQLFQAFPASPFCSTAAVTQSIFHGVCCA